MTDVANQHYLTGYDGWSFYTPQVVVVPAEDEEPVWIGRAMDAAGGRLTAWMRPRTSSASPRTTSSGRTATRWTGSPAGSIGKGWGRRRIGVELDSYYYSPRAHARLVAGLPNATHPRGRPPGELDAGREVPGRDRLSAQAARLAEGAVRAAYEVIDVGVRECDAIARIQAAQIAGQPDFSGDITALPPTILGGENASAPHIMWSDRRFGRGRDDSARARRARGAATRPALRGRSSSASAAADGLGDRQGGAGRDGGRARSAMRPGTTAEAVEAAWRGVIARYGLRKESRIGYSIGVAYPPDWGEHTISLRPGDRTELSRGQRRSTPSSACGCMAGASRSARPFS